MHISLIYHCWRNKIYPLLNLPEINNHRYFHLITAESGNIPQILFPFKQFIQRILLLHSPSKNIYFSVYTFLPALFNCTSNYRFYNIYSEKCHKSTTVFIRHPMAGCPLHTIHPSPALDLGKGISRQWSCSPDEICFYFSPYKKASCFSTIPHCIKSAAVGYKWRCH